jgi:prevent-host-death family protein
LLEICFSRSFPSISGHWSHTGQIVQNDYFTTMSTSYSTPRGFSPRIQELPTITATELKHSTADVLDQVIGGKAVAVTRHDKPRAVLISVEQYQELTGGDGDWLARLHEEYRGMLDRMQAPEQKAAALRAFNATPEELGKAAVAAAMKSQNTKARKSHAG